MKHLITLFLLFLLFTQSAFAAFDMNTDYAALMIAAAARGDQAAYDAAAASRAEKIAAKTEANSSYKDPGIAGSGGNVSVADVCTAVSGGSVDTSRTSGYGTSSATQDQIRAIGAVAASLTSGSGVSSSELSTLTRAIADVNRGTATQEQIAAASEILCAAQGNSTSQLNLEIAGGTITAGSSYAYFRGDGSEGDIVYEGGRAYCQNAQGNWVVAPGYPEVEGATNLSTEDLNALMNLRISYSGKSAEEKAQIHAQAEAIREKYHYSGGTNGSFYDAKATEVTVSGPSGTQVTLASYVILSSSGEGGSISKEGASYVVRGGASPTYTATAQSGWTFSHFLIDETTKVTSSSFSFQNVTGNHTIRAVFQSPPRISILSAEVSTPTLKSGYGIDLKVRVSSDQMRSVRVTAKNSATNKTYILEELTPGVFQLPKNKTGITASRVDYLPVSLADGTYQWKVEAGGITLPGYPIGDSTTITYQVLGSMYDDDAIGDQH